MFPLILRAIPNLENTLLVDSTVRKTAAERIGDTVLATHGESGVVLGADVDDGWCEDVCSGPGEHCGYVGVL